jgi:hypothetical protein
MRTMKDAAYALMDEGIISAEVARTLLATSASDAESGEGGDKRTAKSATTKFGSGF